MPYFYNVGHIDALDESQDERRAFKKYVEILLHLKKLLKPNGILSLMEYSRLSI